MSPPSWPRQVIPAGILAMSMAALGSTLVMQFNFDLIPCMLCLYQRILYAVTAILAAVALCLSPPRRRALVALCGVVFGLNTVVALYHVGAENHWWFTPICTGSADSVLSLAELQFALEQPAGTPCDKVQWSLFGLSLSGYNIPASLGLALFCLAAVKRKTWWRTSRHA
ncbi:Periplasmic thiol:disulfide oxidoreductase DsbB, required for DsbA reoxidation [invertebrate metagenome]|uniref:Periplasmic thiol:disulfide oxidoreductase DsbB, required for DsbA reoxidation n=1 Tax=invertebrate metagenome TaxID=1711999 RepID=A0A484H5J6_9ZZZZ